MSEDPQPLGDVATKLLFENERVKIWEMRLEPGEDGVRRALRVALRASARIRRLNPYLLKHFGVQVSTAAGLGAGMLLEGKATAGSSTGAGLPGMRAVVMMMSTSFA